MATTSDLRNGLVIKFNGELHVVTKWEHRTPGNLRAFYQVKMKNLKNGKMIENRFRSGEEIEVVRLETRNFQYLYKDGTGYVFMDNENFDQVSVSEDIIGEQSLYLKEGENVQIMFNGEVPVSVELPPHVELKVIEAPPGIKGDTATGGTKQVKTETGAVINAPLFIEEGDVIKVDSRTGEYIERVKK
ncbi:MAG: elongation factor P [Ignavibacteria bacterium]|nr:elongation factor P [Ignavibacteria bacterium]